MRFAYFISLHHKPYQFEWLFNAIYNADDIFLIHIDLKTRSGIRKDRRGVARAVAALVEGRPNVRLMPSRYSNWGGWSLSKLTLDAIDILLRLDPDWTHFINLSGQCYPTKSRGEIVDRIGQAGERQFVQLRPFADLPADDWHLRRAWMIETPVRAFALPIARRPPATFSLEHKGAQWVMLTRRFCEWQREAPLRRAVSRYLSFAHLSDELVFQALTLNGPFREAVTDDYGRSILWPGPKLLTVQDAGWLAHAPGLFGRKFDAAVDAEILETLAERGGYRPGPDPPEPDVSRAAAEG